MNGLSFLSMLVWQGIVVGFLLLFREQLAALLRRISRAEIAGSKFDFQLPSPTAKTIEVSKKESEEDRVDADGFLTQAGITETVLHSSSSHGDDTPAHALLIFATQRQRTWLVATDKALYCILDDDKTRASGRLLQWRLVLENAKPISAIEKNSRVGLLTVGPRKNWYYSKRLFPTPESLEEKVRRIVETKR